MWPIKSFAADAGGWGVASNVAGLLAYAVGLYEHSHGKSLSAFVFIAISVPLFWLGSYIAYSKKATQLKALESVPPDIIVRLRELYRNPVDHGRMGNNNGEFSWDIFLLAHIELRRPQAMTVFAYKFELVLNGMPQLAQSKNDVADWHLHIVSAMAGRSFRQVLNPLPYILKLGQPGEGWLHFVTEPTTYARLDESSVRLIAVTEKGSSYSEHQPDPAIWNPVSAKRILPNG